jgi:ribosomal RNA-processing protein 12
MHAGATTRRKMGAARLADNEDAPVDLLDMSTSRALSRSAAGAPDEPAIDNFARNELGKLVIAEEDEGRMGKDRGSKGNGRRGEEDVFATPWRKRRRAADADSDDSDFEDMKEIIGLKTAYRKTANADSLKQVGRYAHSQKTAQTRMTGRSRMSSMLKSSTRSHGDSTAKFKAKGAGGDLKGSSKVEPFAYWRFDRNLLNARNQKKRAAKSRLGGVVAIETPSRGAKSKKKVRRAAEGE